jgi:hypothetical protein
MTTYKQLLLWHNTCFRFDAKLFCCQQLSVHAPEWILETVSLLSSGFLATGISCIAAREIFPETMMNVNVCFMRSEFIYKLNYFYFSIFSDPPLDEADIPIGEWLCHCCRHSAVSYSIRDKS